MLSGDDPLEAAEESRMVELLRGHGQTIAEVVVRGEGMEQLYSSAVRAGALPNLTAAPLNIDDPDDRQVLTGGMLRLLENAEVIVNPADEEQLAVLEQLRHLPHLRCIIMSYKEIEDAVEGTFPPFIPPSLKTLFLEFSPAQAMEALLRDLPSLLRASGASLEEIEIEVPNLLSAQGGAALGQASPPRVLIQSQVGETVRHGWASMSSVPRTPASWCRASRAVATRSSFYTATGPSPAPSPPPAPASRV
jgi:hypothetical protein